MNIGSAMPLPILYFVYPQNVVCYVQENGWPLGVDGGDKRTSLSQGGP